MAGITRNISDADTLQYVVTQPLLLLNPTEKYDIVVNLDGGGEKARLKLFVLVLPEPLLRLMRKIKNPLRPMDL